MWAHDLVPANHPSFAAIGISLFDWDSLTDEQRELLGWLPLMSDPEDPALAPLGYLPAVEETRDGRRVAVQYALGTLEERKISSLRLAVASARAELTAARQTAEAKGWWVSHENLAGNDGWAWWIYLGQPQEAQARVTGALSAASHANSQAIPFRCCSLVEYRAGRYSAQHMHTYDQLVRVQQVGGEYLAALGSAVDTAFAVIDACETPQDIADEVALGLSALTTISAIPTGSAEPIP